MGQVAVKLTAVNGAQIRDAYRKATEAVRTQGMTQALQGMGHQLEGYTKVNLTTLNLIKTGNLRGSIQVGKPHITGNTGEVDVGTNVVYAGIHEFGGFIRPRNAKHLAIPQPGVKGSPRSHPDLRYVPSKSHPGEGFLVDKTGKRMYWLAKVVHMPAKPYFRPALNNNVHNLELTAAGILQRVLKKAWLYK